MAPFGPSTSLSVMPGAYPPLFSALLAAAADFASFLSRSVSQSGFYL